MASNIFYLLIRVTWNLVCASLFIPALFQSKWIAYGVSLDRGFSVAGQRTVYRGSSPLPTCLFFILWQLYRFGKSIEVVSYVFLSTCSQRTQVLIWLLSSFSICLLLSLYLSHLCFYYVFSYGLLYKSKGFPNGFLFRCVDFYWGLLKY